MIGAACFGQKTVMLSDFGPHCDGHTPDNAALTKAINSGANVVLFPSAVCVIDDFRVPSGLTIGSVKQRTSTVKASTSPHIFNIQGSRSNLISNVVIKDLNFSGRKPGYSLRDGAIYISYAKHIVIDNNKASEIELATVRSGLKYDQVTDQDLSSDIKISNNVCSSIQKVNDQCVDVHEIDGGQIEGNTSRGFQNGLMFTGGDAAKYYLFTQPRWVRNVTFSNNDVADAGMGGIWGAKGENIKYLNNKVANVGDVGLDFEGCVSALARGNTCHNARNGCTTAFFINKGVVFEKNNLVQPAAKQPLARIYNSRQSADNTDIEFRDNIFDCEDPTETCTVDDDHGPASGIIVTGNQFKNTRLSLVFNNSEDLHVFNNTFVFSQALNNPAVRLRTYGKKAYVYQNSIQTSMPPSPTVPAIELSNNDFNHNSDYYIGSNKVLGFSTALRTSVEGKNKGTKATFVVCPNTMGVARINGPQPPTGGQQAALVKGNEGDCTDPKK